MTRRVLLLAVALSVLIGTAGLAPVRADDNPKAEAELAKLLTKHVRALMSFAKKWKKRDPDLAEQALRRVIQIRPKHADAEAMLRAMGRFGRRIVLFDGESLDLWHHADAPTWRVEGREIRGSCKDAAYLMRTLEAFEGDYLLRMEARFIKANGEGATLFALGGDADDDETRTEVGLLRKLPYVQRKTGDTKQRLHSGNPDDFQPRLESTAWNEYEIEFEGTQVAARINGRELARALRGDRTGGYATMVVQDCEFAIRRIEVWLYEP